MLRPFIDFKPAQYVETKTDSYVSYYAKHPETDRLERKRVRLNHIHNKTERRKYGRLLACEINSRLYSGWNPFVDELASRGCKTLFASVDEFLSEKKKILRIDSMRSYNSLAAIFKEWCASQGLADKYCFSFDRSFASRFMRDMESGGNLSARTYNNYLRYFGTLFLWLIKRGYASANPFQDIAHKRVDTKMRTVIPHDDRKRIRDYYINIGMREFVLVMNLCFRCLIRPKEILQLRVRDFDFSDNVITIPSSVAKNHHYRVIAIPEDLVGEFKYLSGYAPDLFVFSTDYKPGNILLTTRSIGRVWSVMRRSLGLPMEFQFYSLKDSGITEMLEAGVPPKLVKELADHSSLEMTEKYLHKSSAKKILEWDAIRF
ncbi:MAG: tyrosine-type recombinase/integrase [Bacteroidales bacterium]|nr:tyrosine-type recombinase/integrase [Bacteroidales bacterium]